MTAYIVGLASVALFALLLKLGGLVGVSQRIISETTASVAVSYTHLTLPTTPYV